MQTEKKYKVTQEIVDSIERRRYLVENFMTSKSKGAELGVFRGHFSEFILRVANPDLFYMVDGWELLYEEKYPNWGEYTCFGELPTSVAKQESFERTKFHHNRNVITQLIPDFLESLKNDNQKLDFFYIDSSHNYKDTLNELDLIYKLGVLEENGFIIGDDWDPNPNAIHHGVCRAVNDFIKINPFQIIHADTATGQFVIRKLPQYQD